MILTELKNVEETKFGLKYKGKESYVDKSNNDGCSDCVEESYSLTTYETEEGLWLVGNRDIAEFVIFNSTEWFNAGYSTPMHKFKPEDLTIYEVQVEVKVKTKDLPMEINNVLEGKFNFDNQYGCIQTYYIKNGELKPYSEWFKSERSEEMAVKVIEYNENHYRILSPNRLHSFVQMTLVKKEDIIINK